MSRIMLLSLCALVACTSTAGAAQITFNQADTNTTAAGWQAYGNYDYMMFDISSGQPDYDAGYQTASGSNPDFIASFTSGVNNGGGGGGGGGGNNGGGGSGEGGFGSQNASGDIYYDLVLNDGKDFTLSTLFYNANYGNNNGMDDADIALEVRLIGPNDLDDTWHQITVAELEAGVFLSWDVVVYDDDVDKSLTIDINYVEGEGDAAAGFFLDNVQDAAAAPIPEPATLGLMLFGAAGIFVRRKRTR